MQDTPQAGAQPGGAPRADVLPPLTAAQARVLGCLVEKEATTPDTYPLTVSAAQAAANQKTAREPVMALSAGEVQHALRQLEQMGLARQGFSSRAERHAHRAGERLGLTRQQVALLGLLLLRGPQTAHELLARSERMASFQGIEDVRHHLERLARHAPPLVATLARGGGQREERFAHLLCGPVDAGSALPANDSGEPAEHPAPPPPALAARVAALEDAVSLLQAQVAALRGGQDAA